MFHLQFVLTCSPVLCMSHDMLPSFVLFCPLLFVLYGFTFFLPSLFSIACTLPSQQTTCLYYFLFIFLILYSNCFVSVTVSPHNVSHFPPFGSPWPTAYAYNGQKLAFCNFNSNFLFTFQTFLINYDFLLLHTPVCLPFLVMKNSVAFSCPAVMFLCVSLKAYDGG
jgi:hypothetical protein